MTTSATGLTLLDGVRWQGEPVPGERGHDLLAVLTLAAPRAVAVGDLVERLWPDEEPAHPEKALQVLVSRTRSRTSSDVVVHGAAGYRLGLRDDQVDALRVRQLVRQAREAQAAGDLDVVRHAAAEALSVQADVATEGPLGDLAAAIRADQDVARRLLGAVLLGRGDAEEALPLLLEVWTRRPGDEDVMVDLLRAEAGARGVPAALERYAAYVDRTLDATGAEPGQKLRRLHAELLARDAPVRAGLKYDAAPLVGRDSAVGEVRSLLTGNRVVSLIGAGGLGKTRMAHLVGRLAEQPVVHFVELAGVTEPEGVLPEVANALGVRESLATMRTRQGTTDLRSRLAEQLAGPPTLLILDNCEHLVDAVADLVAYLVATTDSTTVLTTSRAPLGIAAERVYQLAQLSVDEAVELFGQRARSARSDVRLEDEEVAALVSRLDGLPLAIELAAAKVRVMSVAEIGRRLGDRFALLAGGDRTAPDRHRTLEAVIDWSWNLLREDDKAALGALSVFPDGFSFEGAEAILGREPLAALAELVDQSLLVVREGSSIRYRLLETVREYGAKRLAEAGASESTRLRLRDWAVQLARQLQGRLYTPEQVAVMGEVRQEVGNLSGVMRSALEAGDEQAVIPLVGMLAGFWSIEGDHLTVFGLTGPVLDLIGRSAPAEGIDPDELRGVLGLLVINEAIFTGTARPDSLDILRELGEGSGRTTPMARLLLAMYGEESADDPLAALHALGRDPDPLVARTALQWACHALENNGDVEGALRAGQAALVLCDDADGPWTRALIESMLAGLAVQTGQWTLGVGYANAAVPVMDALGSVEDTLQLRSVLALADLGQGRIEAARAAFQEIGRDERSQQTIAWTVGRVGLAELAIAEGEVDRALELYRMCVEVARERKLPESDFPVWQSPWMLFAESSALVAYVHVGRREDGRDLAEALRGKAAKVMAEDSRNTDYPVVGCVLLALGAWDLAGDPDAKGRADAVRALALALRFAYQRTLPSMSWTNVEALADRYAPGQLDAAVAAYADRLPAELRGEAIRVLHA